MMTTKKFMEKTAKAWLGYAAEKLPGAVVDYDPNLSKLMFWIKYDGPPHPRFTPGQLLVRFDYEFIGMTVLFTARNDKTMLCYRESVELAFYAAITALENAE